MSSREGTAPEHSPSCPADDTSNFLPDRERVELALRALGEAMASCSVMREFRASGPDERSASAVNVLALRTQQLLEIAKALLEDERYSLPQARDTIGGA